MTDFRTPTPKHRRAKSRSITPETEPITVSPDTRDTRRHTDKVRTEIANRFGALAFDSDSDTEDEQDWGKMTDNDGKHLEAYVQGLKTTSHPTKVDIVNFKRNVANALTKCLSETNAAGHSYIIETEEQFRLRLKKPSASLPVNPVQPMMPTGTSTTAWKQFEYKRSVYNKHREYSLQTKDLIIKYFPGNFTGLYDADGNLPIELTLKQMLLHLEEKVADDAADAQNWKKIMQGLFDRKHRPNNNGMEKWFAEAEEDSRMCQQLGFKPIDYDTIIICAQDAARMSGLHKDKIRSLEEDWKLKKEILIEVEANEAKKYDTFKSLYIKRTKTLYIDSDTKNQHASRMNAWKSLKTE